MGDMEFAKKTQLPENLAPAIHRPILELTMNPQTNAVLLKYSPAFANEQMLAMAGDTPVSAVVIPLGLSEVEITMLAEELQAALESRQ